MRIVKSRLFLVSYAPLALIFALRAIPVNWTASVVWLIIAAVGLTDGLRLLHLAGRRAITIVTFTQIQDAGGSAAAYLATYLLPLLTTSPEGPSAIAAYIVYFGVLLLVYVNSDMAFVNPTVYVFRRRIVAGTVASGRTSIVICKEVPVVDVPVRAVQFVDVYIIKS